MERQNSATHDRCIYIHGTPEERHIGKPFSFGCIRMRSRDVIALYDRVHIGMHVTISEKPIDELLPREKPTLLSRADYGLRKFRWEKPEQFTGGASAIYIQQRYAGL